MSIDEYRESILQPANLLAGRVVMIDEDTERDLYNAGIHVFADMCFMATLKARIFILLDSMLELEEFDLFISAAYSYEHPYEEAVRFRKSAHLAITVKGRDFKTSIDCSLIKNGEDLDGIMLRRAAKIVSEVALYFFELNKTFKL